MLRHNLLLLALFAALTLHATVVNYTADDKTDFPNPERGYYEMVEVHMNGNGGGVISDGYFTNGRAANRSLILRHYYMEHYVTTQTISQADLNLITQDMAKFRQNGCKAIIRFSYGSSYNSDTDYSHDASETIMYQHMQQLKPILAANADVIYVVQAGFVGVWGEWYYSYTFGVDCNNNTAARNRVITQLLDMVPADRALQLRTPQYMAEFIGNGTADYNTPLTAANAYNGSDAARLGHHNDAFCNGAANLGTYRNLTTQKPWLAATGLYVPMGGETCLGTWDSGYQNTYTNYNTGAKSEADMILLHYDYLNYSYSQYVTGRWKNETVDGENYYDRIGRLMGYRYEMVSAALPDKASAGAQVSIQLNIRNNGYSQLYNERHAYLVLRQGATAYKVQLASDPRFWAPNGALTTISETVTLPSAIPAGTYQLYLALPDAYASLSDKPAFAVRFANPGIWNATYGENDLGASITIGSGLTPSVDPDINPGETTEADYRIDLSTAVAPTVQSASCTWTLSQDSVLTVSYSTASGWLYTGVSFPIDNLTNIISVTFDYKGSTAATTWTALLPFLQDEDYRWWDQQDYPIMSDEWQTVTMTPSVALWESSPAHAYAAKPIFRLGFYANPMNATTASFSIRNVKLRLRVPATDIGTAAEANVSAPQAEKFFRNGQLLIRTAFGVFTPSGIRVE